MIDSSDDSDLLARRLAAIVDSSDDAIVSKDLQGIIYTWNVGAERIFGYTADEMIGASILRLIPPHLHSEEQEILSRLTRGERIDHYETDRIAKDGRLLKVSLTISPIRDSKGKIVGASKVARDITAQREGEEELRTSKEKFQQLWTTTSDAIVIIDANRGIQFANPAVLSTFGYSEEELIAGGFDLLVPEPPQTAHVAEIKQYLENKVQKLNWKGTEIIVRHKNGNEFPVEISFCHFKERNRDLFAVFMRDISERKEAEFSLKRAKKEAEKARQEAEQASRLKDEFLATLSHELRTPLNAVLGWANILKNSKPDEEELEKGLSTIERNAKAQAQIIEDLLDMSRIISGKVRLDVQRVDLPAILRDAIETVRATAEAKSIRLQAVLDPRAAPVSGDPNRLQQIFWNILTNAIKFTPKGGRIQIVLERVNSHLEINVIDSGEGIDPDFLPHVFDRFQQADGSTTRRHGGLGLGLAIVKQLVSLHGGTVWAKSAGLGKGATFAIHLPVLVVHSEPSGERQHPRSSTPTPETLQKTSLSGVRVLVVDDEKDARDLVKRLLELAGAVVATTGSATEAMISLKSAKPNVLISDVGMPDEDGYALIARVREIEPELPALALTAYARSEDRTKAIRAGFDYHLSKPVDAAELLAVIARLSTRT